MKKVVLDTVWMAGSTSLRLLAGLILFVLLARIVGATDFGRLMMWFAVGALASLPCNYGLSIYLLREVPRTADRGVQLLSDALLLKLAISALTLFVLILVGFALPADRWILLLLVAMHLIESFTDLLCAYLRAGGAFSAETRFVTRQAIVQFVIVASVAWFSPTVMSIAAAFAASRAVSVVLAVLTVKAHLNVRLAPSTWPRARVLLRGAHAYFVDFGVQSTLVQIDVVMLAHFAGAAAVGLYQAGMRLAHGISQAITIGVNVALPRLSKESERGGVGTKRVLQVFGVFGAAGACVSVPIYCLAPQIASLLFGKSFAGLDGVLRVIAIFLFIRFLGAAAGVLLIALGDQRSRATVMVGAVASLATLAVLLMPSGGAVGAAQAMTITYVLIALALTTILIVRLKNSEAGSAPH